MSYVIINIIYTFFFRQSFLTLFIDTLLIGLKSLTFIRSNLYVRN